MGSVYPSGKQMQMGGERLGKEVNLSGSAFSQGPSDMRLWSVK